MPHKIDELLEVRGLLTDIDVILDLTGDSKALYTLHPPHFPYETVDFSTILGTVSTFI
jgi:hypothetical protein